MHDIKVISHQLNLILIEILVCMLSLGLRRNARNWTKKKDHYFDERNLRNWTKKKDHYFHQRQRISIVFIYEHIFCKLEECDWKRYNMINNIIGILCLRKNAHRMVFNVLREFLHCKRKKIPYTGERKKNGVMISYCYPLSLQNVKSLQM